MFYRVEIIGSIIGNLFNNEEIPYQLINITAVETLDKSLKTNCIYRTDNKFEFCIVLDEPTSLQIIEAKNKIRQKMLFELNKVINNLSNIKTKLEKEITFEN